ncbi:hypothetical protein [Clostridium algidicarnis]|uniref:hypothetical protein n=1 Tax=Clostridium algidicarnis TaxID=37659 RepID=UPI003FD78315
MNEYQRRVLEGRKEFLKLAQKQEKELLKIYEEAGRQVSYKLSKAKPGGITARYLSELDRSIDRYILELKANLSKSIKNGIEASSQIGSAVQLSYLDSIVPTQDIKTTFNKMFTQLPNNITKQLISGNYYSDGKTLDKRLWDITRKNARDIDTLIKVNVASGVNAKELARELEAYINPLNRIAPKTLEAGMSSKISYQSQRLARTSLTHANIETYIQGAKMNPFSKGLKWNLSPSHSERMQGKKDICDEYASQNSYELGIGVYPTNQYPLAHCNCLCYPTQENVDINKAEEELIAWVNGEDNPKLDKWLKDYGENYGIKKNKWKSFNGLVVSNQDNSGIIKEKELNELKDYKEPLARRHNLNFISKKSVAKDKNTIIMPSVDVHKDIEDIRKGLFKKIDDNFEVNGRVYGKHDGRFYPISGEHFITLNRNEYKLLIKLKTEFNNPRVMEFLKNMGSDEETISKLVDILKKGGIE